MLFPTTEKSQIEDKTDLEFLMTNPPLNHQLGRKYLGGTLATHYCSPMQVAILKGEMSNKENPACLWYIGDDKLPSHVRIIISHYLTWPMAKL